MAQTIKSCPFCGADARLKETVLQQFWGPDVAHYQVCCTNKRCIMALGVGWTFENDEDVIREWNRRVELSPAPSADQKLN
jgi:hypothetical protein